MNLIDNAIRYNYPGGSVVLASSLGEKQARMSVGNTGPGIPAEAQTHIFDRFYRNHLAPNEATGGHGLGLSIAREIARAHGGDVTLVCSDSRWTEFALALPSHGRPDGATVAASLTSAVKETSVRNRRGLMPNA